MPRPRLGDWVRGLGVTYGPSVLLDLFVAGSLVAAAPSATSERSSRAAGQANGRVSAPRAVAITLPATTRSSRADSP